MQGLPYTTLACNSLLQGLQRLLLQTTERLCSNSCDWLHHSAGPNSSPALVVSYAAILIHLVMDDADWTT
jgi:hypothetical protein